MPERLAHIANGRGRRPALQTDVVLVGILLYALLGKIADVAAKGLERVCLRWHPSYT